jgi:hypothetical protein
MSSDGWLRMHPATDSSAFFVVICLSRINVHNDCLDAESCDLTWPGSSFLPSSWLIYRLTFFLQSLIVIRCKSQNRENISRETERGNGSRYLEGSVEFILVL